MTYIENYIWKFNSYLFLLLNLFFYAWPTSGQRNCEKVIISACIDLNTELHIKHGKMWWVWNIMAPGADPNCPGKTTVNSIEWKDYSMPFNLNFSTDSCSATIIRLQTNEVSRLIQLPSAENEWETVWLFSDMKSRGPARYSISISFCSLKKSISKKNVNPQSPCKKFTLKACINHEALLHIKNGILTWEQKEEFLPGAHFECGSVGITRINGAQWKDSKSPFKLDFNTNGLNIQPVVIHKNNISELIQKPSAANGWETIWRFFDPADLPHSYSISFTFCPPGYDQSLKDKPVTKKDSLKEKKIQPKAEKKVELTEDIICKVYFDTGKKTLTKNSETDLSKLSAMLKTNNLTVEISGYKTGGLKLYEERSIIIDNLLISEGIDQKRIKYIGYGDDTKKFPAQKTIKCCIIIN
jgi:hypothetical protein